MKAWTAALLLLAWIGGGCANGPSGSAPGASPTRASSPTATLTPPVALTGTVVDTANVDETSKGASFALTIEAHDNYFAPTFIKAVPGATVALTVRNDGQSPHTFTIAGTEVNIVLSSPGQTGTAVVKLPTNGSLAFHCTYHLTLGMQGAFYVG
jgi:plastocyanin